MEDLRNRIKICSTGEAAFSLALSIKKKNIDNKDIYYEYVAKKILEFKDSQYAKLFLDNFNLNNQKTIKKLNDLVAK